MYRNRKGFTIVELVIVIAVIAILAAVLIPTFSSLTQRANLNSDMQAVRQMNMALQNDEALNGKCTTIDQAMQVIANAGYDVDNQWTCLTEGYQVYWNKTDNRCVLYNSTTAKVEYPKDYTGADIIADAGNYFIYNQTFKSAINADLGFSSQGSVVVTEGVGFTSNSAADVQVTLGSNNVTISKDVMKGFASMGIVDSAKLYGYSSMEQEFGSAKVSVDKYAIYNSSDAFTSDGERPNIYYISVTKSDNAADTKSAQQTAGKTVYDVFQQMNNNMVANDANVILAPGTEINIEHLDWKPVKLFEGYFGTPDPENPVKINGLDLNSTVAYMESHQFIGSESKYYLTGFIAAVTGGTENEPVVIENVTFENVKIVRPVTDYSLVKSGYDSNTTAIIGGIVSTPEKTNVNVTLRNVDVVNSSVHGKARTGGLIGYIGGQAGVPGISAEVPFSGVVTIEGCDVECDVTTDMDGSYGTVGGIVGFFNKFYKGTPTINITDCSYKGALKGTYVGGLCGELNEQTGTFNITRFTANVTEHSFVGNSGFYHELIGGRYYFGGSEYYKDTTRGITLNITPALNV